MSVDYYFVCDKCKEISDNALTLNLRGGYVLADVIGNFLNDHFLERICAPDGIRIVCEQGVEDRTYMNINDGGTKNDK